ncbi:RNA polymerase II associated protein 1 [Phytophthora pseudosyringae]|uniref:RNA polymerase II associated protein 1 n=1 Tax=Phytophthora pseudosyringae TaxID=221518 RepID=A0A8T1W698_9STRA|nr:RNA polymerase II associated protein 1 [Phytophthora pseudosyringae]
MPPPNAEGVDMDAELAQLLREQEQFLSQKKRPAAKVSRRGPPPEVSGSKTAEKSSEPAPDEGPQVLKGVVERQVTPVGQQSFVFAPKPTGFPAVKRRGPGQSLFGRRRREAKAVAADEREQVQGKHLDQESRDIDAANRAKLQGMSPQEILEAQQELLRSLDPTLVEKLKKRRTSGKKEEKSGKKEEKSDKKTVAEKQGKKVVVGESVVKYDEDEDMQQLQKEEMIKSLAAVQTEDELKEQAKRLLPAEERAKLAWTHKGKKDEKPPARGKKNARPVAEDATLERFDLGGITLAATDAELPAHSGLFHHGDDPNAAGYTLPELLHLARSSVASQRAMALNVVAKILHNRQLQKLTGLLVVPRVLPRDMALTLRIVLDDQNYTALSAGVSALHSFIVPVEADGSSAEDRCVSELKHGTVVLPPQVHLHHSGVNARNKDHSHVAEEVIYIDTSETDDGTSISDEDLAASDPVQALLNMDLGTRLRYILETIQLPDQYATEKMLDILIAVARHSPRAAHEISSNARLLKLLQQQYIENEQVLTFQEGNIRSLQLSLKSLELVRALCQGQRSVASALITSGLIQSTKGFLALKEVPTGDVDEEAAALFGKMQLESLRIWRILLGYGLDFHCFAYLFPALSGFVQNATESSTARNSALFAALEAFCGLGSVHEAQHYFNQLGFFLDAAKDEAVRSIRLLVNSPELNDVKTILLLSTILRFLAIASAHATKYNLETASLVEVLKLVQSREVTQELLPRLNNTVVKRDLLVAFVRFHQQIVRNNLLSDDMDDEEVVKTFSREVKAPLLSAATAAVALSTAKFSPTLIQACELTLLLGDLIAAGQNDGANFNAEFVQNVYHQALILVERLGAGGEYLTARLFAGVLFHQSALKLLGVFNEEADAIRMSRVLIPIYQALVNATHEQEAHSAQIFTGVSSVSKFSYHLRLPQEEQNYIPSNLPLPSFWMVSPLSRIEYSNSGDGKPTTDVGPTRAQSDEMKLIVSATCRFAFEFERLAPSMSSIPSIAELRPEDKLFHLVHVFFAGSDVLFDDHVNAALRQLLPKLVKPILRSPADSRILFEGILRNLKRIRSLEFGEEVEPRSNNSSVSFSSDERQVLTFIEKLVAEFTASSFGNSHFAQCVTLLLTRDFPLELRKFVWKELQESHLLHTLAPFEVSSAELFKRCTRGGTSADAKLLQSMQEAVCKQQVSPARGAFAYSLAIHHLVVYLFAEGDTSTLSSARQHFAQTLAAEASPAIWGHLLSYDSTNHSSLLSEERGLVLPERVSKLRTQAAFSPDQLLSFEAAVSLVDSTNATK